MAPEETSKQASPSATTASFALGPSPPTDQSSSTVFKFLFLGTLCIACAPTLMFLYLVRGPFVMTRLWQLARQSPIRCPRNNSLFKKVLSLESVQVYLKSKALEYQVMDGFCSVTTQRCICKSVPGFPTGQLPSRLIRGGPATADEFASSLSRTEEALSLKSTVLYGSAGYEAFRNALLRSNDPKQCRVAVNFHRASLSGFPSPSYLPSSWMLAIMGGHFSPILGYLVEEDLVAVFDVNPKHGFFLCDARRLFNAVNTMDVTSGKARGLVVTEIQSTVS